MMEIDRMSYIFGSFTRRRQSQEVSSSKRKSIQPLTIIHDRSKSTPNTSKKPSSIPRAKSICDFVVDDGKFKCPMCRRPFIEPKVLPCLHTLCLRCLQELEANDYSWCDEESDDTSKSRKGSNSGGSGYVSDKNNTLPSCSSKRISCPTCGTRAEVPSGGVSCFPPNYLLQNRMVLATLNAHNTHLLCDLCSSEISATSRCMDCAVSFCEECEETHLRQKAAAGHEVLSLEAARKKGITKVRRQIMCITHPEAELGLFCSTCCQVVCKECISTTHKGHTYELVSRALKSHLTDLRLAAERAKSIAEQSALAANRLHVASKQLESHCGKIQTEIEEFIDNYIRSVEDHRKNLLQQVHQAKAEKLQEIGKRKLALHRKVREARDVAFFVDELLSDATDVEVMSFLKPVMNKMNRCGKSEVESVNLGGSLLFLKEEVVHGRKGCCPLYGVVTTQRVAPEECVVQAEGLGNLRVGKPIEIHLETRDKNGIKLGRGGEQISADIHYRDAGVSKYLPVEIEDHRDGTYTIAFVPDVAGKLALSITIKGQPIKDSPFPLTVRSLKPHQGNFHCCSFCSSGGSKDATCGCGGKMPGGYKGCGHGHEGHPGRRHWSCCGNILEHSECTKFGSHSHYQFTL